MKSPSFHLIVILPVAVRFFYYRLILAQNPWWFSYQKAVHWLNPKTVVARRNLAKWFLYRDLVARRRRKIWGNLLVTGIPPMHSSCFSELPQAEFSALKCKFPASNRSFPLNASFLSILPLNASFPDLTPLPPGGCIAKPLNASLAFITGNFLHLSRMIERLARKAVTECTDFRN